MLQAASGQREDRLQQLAGHEIEKSKELGNRIISVKINLRYEIPEELRHSYASLAKTFSRSAIEQAIGIAAKSR